MEFSRQDYWNGLPLPSPVDLPAVSISLESIPGIELVSPVLAGGLFTIEPPGNHFIN